MRRNPTKHYQPTTTAHGVALSHSSVVRKPDGSGFGPGGRQWLRSVLDSPACEAGLILTADLPTLQRGALMADEAFGGGSPTTSMLVELRRLEESLGLGGPLARTRAGVQVELVERPTPVVNELTAEQDAALFQLFTAMTNGDDTAAALLNCKTRGCPNDTVQWSIEKATLFGGGLAA